MAGLLRYELEDYRRPLPILFGPPHSPAVLWKSETVEQVTKLAFHGIRGRTAGITTNVCCHDGRLPHHYRQIGG
jgi:hypothetical protein